MRHNYRGRKLSRNCKHRQALFSNMVQALIREGRIMTTLPKAKEIKPMADHMVSLAKRGDLNARRMAARMVRTPEVLQKLFDEYPSRFEGRIGGYTRILKLGIRRGDSAEMAILEYLPANSAAEPTKTAE